MKRSFLLLTVLLGACGTPSRQPAGALTVVDDAGDTVHLAAPATRVVSLSPATTELLFAIGAGDRLVGRTRWGDYPPAALEVPSVGDGLPPNIEAVLATHPDLVLLYRSPQNAPALAQLRATGITTLQLTLDHLADVSRLARLLGPVVGHATQGDSLATWFDSARSAAAARAAVVPDSARPRLLVLAWDPPPIAIGAGSFQSEIVELAGGRNVFADLAAPSAPVSIEAIAARDPDLVLVTDSGTPGFATRPEWRVVPAIRDRRFVRLVEPAFGRPSPRALAVAESLRVRLAGWR